MIIWLKVDHTSKPEATCAAGLGVAPTTLVGGGLMRGAGATPRSGRVSVFPRRKLGPERVGVLLGGARVVGRGTEESANSGRA